MAEALQPIIKKKKVINAAGHHGGAWKVAYADFVTAMMAFFLLMWLLNATTEDQRKGIADYFNPTIPLARISGGGSEALNGDSIYTEDRLARDGTGIQGKDNTSRANDDGEEAKEAGQQDGAAAAELEGAVAEDKVAMFEQAIAESDGELAGHLRVRTSPEGLVIEIVEQDGVPLFSVGNATPSPVLEQLLTIVALSFQDIENDIKIVGHTDGRGYAPGAIYTNWDLSSDRANTARRLLVGAGFPATQVAEVSGKADTKPLSEDRFSPENRRISLTILRQD